MANKKKQLTIRDIAKLVGVSPSTVSNALSGERHVKEKTKQKIFKIVKKYSYEPNIIARSLSKKKTGIIGIILPDINNPFYSEVVKGIDEESKRQGYLTVVVNTYYDEKIEIGQLKKLGSMFVDGYIFVGGSCSFGKIRESSESYLENFVLVNRKCKGNDFPSVVIDSKRAIRGAIDYLVEKGHRKISYVGWSSGEIIIPESKYSGYLEGLSKNRIKLNKNMVFLADNIVLNQYKYSYDRITDYLKNEKLGFTAILAQTDIMGLGAMRALQDKGFNVPNSVSVVGYGNIDTSRFSNPSMTSVNLPKRKMGKVGAKILFNAINRKSFKKEIVYLKTKIVERESTKKIK
ncbi:MAG: LacI family DNA-binding transcriptional regulator [Actinomycetota bacterium]